MIFCIDSVWNQYSMPTAEIIFSKESRFNRIITHKELRRMAKLCFDQRIDAEIRQVALETFKYVCVNVVNDPRNQAQGFDLEELPSPFTADEFTLYSRQRKEGKDPS